jgi:uncharacterized membrane protein (DUF485 family)
MFLGFAVLSVTGQWWPWLMVVIGLSVTVKQILRAKFYDAFLAALIFGGIALTTGFNIGGKYFLPVFLIIASIYLLVRAFFQSDVETEAEREEEQNIEIEEETAEDNDK